MTVQLDGTGSSHPEGAIAAYEWTIRTPDGREIEPDCADCERSQFTPSTVGRYAVNLTVTGPNGARSTDTLYVYVEDGGPEVELSGDRTPDPNRAVTYAASARSPDAELDEIAWAVEDEIVAVRSLDGSTDESELSLAFSQTETHRVQVVVRDSNGRTAYDQLYVQPDDGSASPSSWFEAEPTGCEDSTYAARNAVECWDLEEPTRTPEETRESNPVRPETFDIRYETDGYESMPLASTVGSDSSFVGTVHKSVGLDGGENAPWRDGGIGGIIEKSIDRGSTFLFGQEERTVTCKIDGGSRVPTACEQRVFELEERGETTNSYSSTQTGAYSEYGLEGGERARGADPTTLGENQRAEVTIVVQQSEEGIISKSAKAVSRTIEGAGDAADEILTHNDESEQRPKKSPSSSDTENAYGRLSRASGLIGGPNGLLSDSNLTDRATNSFTEPDDNPTGSTRHSVTDRTPSHDVFERNDKGLLS